MWGSVGHDAQRWWRLESTGLLALKGSMKPPGLVEEKELGSAALLEVERTWR